MGSEGRGARCAGAGSRSDRDARLEKGIELVDASRGRMGSLEGEARIPQGPLSTCTGSTGHLGGSEPMILYVW